MAQISREFKGAAKREITRQRRLNRKRALESGGQDMARLMQTAMDHLDDAGTAMRKMVMLGIKLTRQTGNQEYKAIAQRVLDDWGDSLKVSYTLIAMQRKVKAIRES